jgi:hypothetical protein
VAVEGKALGRRRLAAVAGIVTPDTILRWSRRLVAQQYDGAQTRRPRRHSTKPDITALVVRTANENPTWGYTRIRGGLKVGHDVARHTINAILTDHGLEPAPDRGTTTPWTTVRAAQWDGVAAADVCTVAGLTLRGLVRSVVFVMKLKSRTGEIAGITSQPHEAWMRPLARNLTDACDGFLRGVHDVMLDRDPLYTTALRRVLRDRGAKPLGLPAWSPTVNACAERVVGSATSECVARVMLLGEKHLTAAVGAFVHHDHDERPHQGLSNELIAPTTTLIGTGRVPCRARLGGVLKFYSREAA